LIHYSWFLPYSRSIENENKDQFVEGFIKGFEEGFIDSGHKSDEVEYVRNKVPKIHILKFNKGSFFDEPEPDRDLFIDIRNHPGPYESYYDHGLVQGRLRGKNGKFYDIKEEEDKRNTVKYFPIPQEGEYTSDNLKYNQNPSELENISDGKYSYHDEDDGSLLIKNYKNGVQNGPSYYHYNSGELWIEENYSDGKIHGKTIYYNKNGSIKKEEDWKDGEYIK
jgi:antitoxin component YwqK of YwqJK toxin-antitoxin module